MVVAAPLLNEEVLAAELYLLLCDSVGIGKPRTRLTHTVAGIHLTVGITVITFILVVEVHQPYGLIAALSIDTSALGIGITAVQVAEEHVERHVVVVVAHVELVSSMHPVAGLHISYMH